MRRPFWTVLSLLLAAISIAEATERADVLPAGVRRASIRVGYFSHLAERFNGGGELHPLSDFYQASIDSNGLRRLSPDAGRLIDSLNQIGAYRYGDALSPGTITIQPNPELNYRVPTLALGLTGAWTLGVGVPIVHFKNDVRIVQSGSNIPALRSQLSGRISHELDEGLRALDQSAAAVLSSQLSGRGYHGLEPVDQEFIGDVHVQSLWKVRESAYTPAVFQLTAVLPTGPVDDPDTLLDTDLFHRTSLGAAWIQDLRIRRNFALYGRGGYFWRAPDTTTVRVPTSTEDVLPEASTKELVTRDLGDEVSVEGGVRWNATSFLELGLAMERVTKTSDSYAGSRGTRYDLLSQNTSAQIERFKAGVEVSAVEYFQRGRFAIPLSLSWNYSDVFAGQNSFHQKIHEVELLMYF